MLSASNCNNIELDDKSIEVKKLFPQFNWSNDGFRETSSEVIKLPEQFKSDIHDRVKGNCATHAYGRTNAIEISKPDYQFVPPVYKSMLTRLKQGEYILQNPVFRSLLNIKFPRPLYKQFKNG